MDIFIAPAANSKSERPHIEQPAGRPVEGVAAVGKAARLRRAGVSEQPPDLMKLGARCARPCTCLRRTHCRHCALESDRRARRLVHTKHHSYCRRHSSCKRTGGATHAEGGGGAPGLQEICCGWRCAKTGSSPLPSGLLSLRCKHPLCALRNATPPGNFLARLDPTGQADLCPRHLPLLPRLPLLRRGTKQLWLGPRQHQAAAGHHPLLASVSTLSCTPCVPACQCMLRSLQCALMLPL